MAATSRRLLVFSDLDGTLLDKETYSWSAAAEAVDELRERDIPLILVSSKTLPEMTEIRRDLGNNAPFIFENGAGLALPADDFGIDAGVVEIEGLRVKLFGTERSQILDALSRLKEAGNRFEGFSDWTASEVAAVTGLTPVEAARAQDRWATEPFLWRDSEEKWPGFVAALESKGLRVVKGGRFWCAMGRFDKSEAVRWLVARYQKNAAGSDFKTVALGDSPNDSQMLADADIAVVVQSANSEAMEFSQHPRVIRTTEPGPAGWNHAMTMILQEEV